MAIYHLSQKIGKRAQGKNAVFVVAYIRGEQRTCLRTNETKDFSAKQGELIYSNCILPTDAPEWASKVRNAQVQASDGSLTVDKTGHTFSEMAWNQIELMEKRQGFGVINQRQFQIKRGTGHIMLPSIFT